MRHRARQCRASRWTCRKHSCAKCEIDRKSQFQNRKCFHVAFKFRRFIMIAMAPKFVRQTVRQMEGYTPGEQPGPGERVVKLNTNENPFPPSPKVMQAIREVEPEMLRRYPHPTADKFRRAAAK